MSHADNCLIPDRQHFHSRVERNDLRRVTCLSRPRSGTDPRPIIRTAAGEHSPTSLSKTGLRPFHAATLDDLHRQIEDHEDPR